MKRCKIRTQLVLLLTMFVFMMAGPAAAQEVEQQGVFFSTEEEFFSFGIEPPDGNPIISDGDLLHSSGIVYMRNYQLLEKYGVKYDLGLDAVDVIDVKKRFVVFSTELDHPGGAFGAGDLLTTTGAVIPNAALLVNFNIPRGLDLELDAVQVIGTGDRIIKFFDVVRERGRDYWQENPRALTGYLKEYDLDIWFSTEGTPPSPGQPRFLDGDLLSVVSGTIVLSNHDALPNSVPAGIPDRGVDFGMDAAAMANRKDIESRKYLFYSTEILFEDKPDFTDGDVLRSGNGVVMRNSSLVLPFEPAAQFLGLDALSLGRGGMALYPQITHFNMVSVSHIDNSGLAFSEKQPFGNWIQIHGHIPADVDEFRVVFCKKSSMPCAPASIESIPVTSAKGWHVNDDDGIGGCSGDRHWYSNADGWYNAADYRSLRLCNPTLPLTVWYSKSAPDPEGLYVVWLQYRRGAVQTREPYNHYIQLDNTAPENLLLEPKTGSICGQFGPGDMPLMVTGRFKDPHFYWYQLSISGGNPWSTKGYTAIKHDTYASDNVGLTGTVPPPPAMVDLHNINVNDLPAASVDDCAYTVGLRVYDSTIRGGFNPATDYRPVYGSGWRSYIAFTFDYTP